MYRIGYIDDVLDQFPIIEKKIQRRFEDIELVFLDDCNSKEEFVQKIYEKQIDVLLVDYKMVGKFGFNGSTLISYINDQVRDLECFILTAVDPDSINDKQVALRNIRSKYIFDTEGDDVLRVKELTDFINTLKESADVFRTRQKTKKERYLELFDKRKEGNLSMLEEEEYLSLYKVLSSYGMVEKLPKDVLTSTFEKDLESLLETGKAILNRNDN